VSNINHTVDKCVQYTKPKGVKRGFPSAKVISETDTQIYKQTDRPVAPPLEAGLHWGLCGPVGLGLHEDFAATDGELACCNNVMSDRLQFVSELSVPF
jgi:hypothetical protein